MKGPPQNYYLKSCFHRILIFNCSFAYQLVLNYSLDSNRPFQGMRVDIFS